MLNAPCGLSHLIQPPHEVDATTMPILYKRKQAQRGYLPQVCLLSASPRELSTRAYSWQVFNVHLLGE